MVTYTAYGFDGRLREDSAALMFGRYAGNQDAVSDPGAWAVSAVQNATMTVSVAASSGYHWAWGVLVKADAAVTLQAPALPAGTTRWDMIAVRRDWTPDAASGGGTASLVIIPGTAAMALPAAGAGTSQRQGTPGVRHDSPVALVNWAGGTQPASIVDLRVQLDSNTAYVTSAAANTILGAHYLVKTAGSGNPEDDLDTIQSAVKFLVLGSPRVDPGQTLLTAANRGAQAPSAGYLIRHFTISTRTNNAQRTFGYVTGDTGGYQGVNVPAGTYAIHAECTMQSAAAHTADIRIAGTLGRAGTQTVSPAGGALRNLASGIFTYPNGGYVQVMVSNNATHTFISGALDIQRIA